MQHRVCPWWLGHLLAGPLRRLFYHPEVILLPYIREGMTVLDAGCGMGFFSLPIAKMVGSTGKVICIDLQDKMMEGLMKRARKSGMTERIDPRVCSKDHFPLDDVAGRIDFALAFALIHEVPDKDRLLSEIYAAMKRDCKLMIAEPSGHVRINEFEETVRLAMAAGFKIVDRPQIRRSHVVLLQR